MTDDPTSIGGEGLSPDEIREFPGLTDEEIKGKLTAARMLGSKVALRLQPPRCWIETIGGEVWYRETNSTQTQRLALTAERA